MEAHVSILIDTVLTFDLTAGVYCVGCNRHDCFDQVFLDFFSRLKFPILSCKHNKSILL